MRFNSRVAKLLRQCRSYPIWQYAPPNRARALRYGL